MWPNPQFPVDLVTFTEEIFNGKIHFLYSVTWAVSNENKSFLCASAVGKLNFTARITLQAGSDKNQW